MKDGIFHSYQKKPRQYYYVAPYMGIGVIQGGLPSKKI
jgi:hypothetical protein